MADTNDGRRQQRCLQGERRVGRREIHTIRSQTSRSANIKYVFVWWERPGGSATDYDDPHKRVLRLFSKWEQPGDFTNHRFLVRVGEYGGYIVAETDNPATLYRLSSTHAVFQFRIEPVDVRDPIAAGQEAIAWRDSVG